MGRGRNLWRWRADPRNGRPAAPGNRARRRGIEASAAKRAMDAVFLSPVFPTRSHPEAATLGVHGFHVLAQQSPVPVIALGGMTKPRAQELAVAALGRDRRARFRRSHPLDGGVPRDSYCADGHARRPTSPTGRRPSAARSARAGEIFGAALFALTALFLALALASYTQTDPSGSTAAAGDHIANWMGAPGAWVSDKALGWFGLPAVLLLPLLYVAARRLWLEVETAGEAETGRWWRPFGAAAGGDRAARHRAGAAVRRSGGQPARRTGRAFRAARCARHRGHCRTVRRSNPGLDRRGARARCADRGHDAGCKGVRVRLPAVPDLARFPPSRRARGARGRHRAAPRSPCQEARRCPTHGGRRGWRGCVAAAPRPRYSRSRPNRRAAPPRPPSRSSATCSRNTNCRASNCSRRRRSRRRSSSTSWRSSAMRACSKPCSTISTSRARSPQSAPAR